eukprot:TRINITY_DN3768_c0_g1_i13.p1 TRINITY_DN3768_c0_g1~~TRINITY_DN3768_c0_g1_i13.p1  ORF type:complete len:317 (+),score=31.05 TRINITY_DN3768_c0_g1_i13:161-1111(+)
MQAAMPQRRSAEGIDSLGLPITKWSKGWSQLLALRKSSPNLLNWWLVDVLYSPEVEPVMFPTVKEKPWPVGTKGAKARRTIPAGITKWKKRLGSQLEVSEVGKEIARQVGQGATGTSQAQLARAISKTCGPQIAGDAVVKRLSSVEGKSAVKAAHAVFVKTKLAIDVQQTVIPNGPAAGITVIRLTDFVAHMVRSRQLHRLYGGLDLHALPTTLQLFWSRLRNICPTHSIFMAFDHGTARPGFTIPCYVHGDEGRGLKRSGVLVVSTMGALGKGTAKQRRVRPDVERQQSAGGKKKSWRSKAWETWLRRCAPPCFW